VRQVKMFRFSGVVALMWCIVWLMCVTENPADDKHITREELKFIVDSIGPVDEKNGRYVVAIHYFSTKNSTFFEFFQYFILDCEKRLCINCFFR